MAMTAAQREASAKSTLMARKPDFPLDVIDKSLEEYIRTGEETEHQLEKELLKISDLTLRLQSHLCTTVSDGLINRIELEVALCDGFVPIWFRRGRREVRRMGDMLGQLHYAANSAALKSRTRKARGRGGAKAKRVRLVHSIANGLAQAGVEVDAKPNGHLCQGFECAVEILVAMFPEPWLIVEGDEFGDGIWGEAEETVSDIPGTVRNALKTWNKNEI